MANVSKNIKRLRAAANITQQELADRLNVTRQAVSSWENGKNQPDIQTIEELAKIFDVTVEEVIYGPKTARNRKKLIGRAIIWGVVCIGIYILMSHFAEMAHDWASRTYNAYVVLIILLVCRPFCYVLMGIFAGSFVTLFFPIEIKNTKYRKICTILGFVIAVGLSFYGLWYFWSGVRFFNNFSGIIFHMISNLGYRIVYEIPATYIVPGILLWIGIAKEP